MLETDLLIGAIGWHNDNWQNGFYPEELPEDWRLGYYSNHLRAVLVPPETWRSSQANTEEWLQDIYPEFRMVLAWEPGEGDPVASVTRFLQQSGPIADNVDAYLVLLDGPAESQLARAISMLSAHRPVSLVGRNYKALDIDPVLSDTANIAECWLPDSQEKPAAKGEFLVVLTSERDGKVIRKIIDEINRWPDTVTGAKGAALFFTGDRGADTALQARTIAELMGV